METKQYQFIKRAVFFAFVVFALFLATLFRLTSSADSAAARRMQIPQPTKTGIITSKEYIPSHWFTHVIEDAKGRRIVQDFAPDQWLINVTLTTGQVYRFNTDQAGYDTLKLNTTWPK